jgi:hypothetical protein
MSSSNDPEINSDDDPMLWLQPIRTIAAMRPYQIAWKRCLAAYSSAMAPRDVLALAIKNALCRGAGDVNVANELCRALREAMFVAAAKIDALDP